MRAVYIAPHEDIKEGEIFLVENIRGHGSFEKDYEKILTIIKTRYKYEWDFNQILSALEEKGWQILRPSNQVFLTY